jgi:hypothetical protein
MTLRLSSGRASSEVYRSRSLLSIQPGILFPLCAAAWFQLLSASAAAGGSCSAQDYEYVLSTASVVVQPCFADNYETSGTLATCPVDASVGTAFAFASIVACYDTIPAAKTESNVSCEVSLCSCTDEDDEECTECPIDRAESFPCSPTPVQIGSRPCLRLVARIPLSFISQQMSAVGQYSHAHDRVIFQMSSPSAPTDRQSTPPLGPWAVGRLQRWIPVHSHDDEYFSALDLRYKLVRLGNAWPDAVCLDGSKGAYYM